MIVAGCDTGMLTTKAVLVRNDVIIAQDITETRAAPKKAARRAMDNALSSEGILRGDYLTVDLLTKPKNNDVAAMRLGERIYIRKIFYDPQYIRLQSPNVSVAPLIIDPKTPGFEILGKVIAVIREL